MNRKRLQIAVRGAVQGVGFRPFVHRLARELKIGGSVRNEGAHVLIEAEGEAVDLFLDRLSSAPPAGARIAAIESTSLPVRDETRMVIGESRPAASARCIVPDRVTCPACLDDILDPKSRYFGYPFTNCTECGPRYSICDALPYDRPHTAMADFPMCADCRGDYEDPNSRRFHAQPIACAACGPTLTLRETDGTPRQRGPRAWAAAAELLVRGGILACKGLGGYQLLADAENTAAVQRLRARKNRPHKPFAVMVPDIDSAHALCVLSPAEAALLQSPAGPIVLARARPSALSEAVHPHQVETGLLLPTTPLHHLLLRRIGRPLICTSGNRGAEPICIDEAQAIERLGSIADRFLTHDRPIRRPIDDSVARILDGAPQVLRLARGYAPLVLPLEDGTETLAVGAHLKNALAVADGHRVVTGPHVGDLNDTLAIDAMRRQAVDLEEFFAVSPRRTAHDRHPDYASTTFARERGLPATAVQHHLAHALAAMVEHDSRGPVLAVVWDGAGFGSDGTIWGGEFLSVRRESDRVHWSRVASVRAFRLPGGDAAARDPKRALAGLLYEIGEHDRIPTGLRRQLESGAHAPWCTSAGRLFDGVAALLGHEGPQTYEGMAATLLESTARRSPSGEVDVAPPALRPGARLILDWSPTLASLLLERDLGRNAGALSAAFHHALADALPEVAESIGHSTVVLTGGCFQNRVLSERAAGSLRDAGFEVLHPRQLPPNDGGIAVGQLAAAGGVDEHVPGDTRSN